MKIQKTLQPLLKRCIDYTLYMKELHFDNEEIKILSAFSDMLDGMENNKEFYEKVKNRPAIKFEEDKK